MTKKQDNGWSEWRHHVLIELERLNKGQSEMKIEISKIQTNVTVLKLKAGVWGAIAGMIPVLIMLLINFINK